MQGWGEKMLELTLVVFIVGGILSVRWIPDVSFSPSDVSEWGILILAMGIIEGIPTGLYYHVVLYRFLHPRGKLPSGWWLSPRQYHVHLTKEEGRRVKKWFFLGGLGFLLCVIGGAVAFLGMFPGLVG